MTNRFGFVYDVSDLPDVHFLPDEEYIMNYKLIFEESLDIIKTIETFEIAYPIPRRVFCWQYNTYRWSSLDRTRKNTLYSNFNFDYNK